MDEARLIRKLRSRDRGALEHAIRQYTPYVSAVVHRTLGDALPREDMEEAVSDAFLALWAHAGDYDGEKGPFLPWLGAIARNKALNKLRAREPALPLGDDVAAPDRPDEEAERRDSAAELWRAVEALPPPDDALFLRYYYYGEKLKDIAKALGMNGQTAKTHLARGRAKLRELLTKGEDGR